MDVNEINVGDRVHANPSSEAEIVRVDRDADGRKTDVGAVACTKESTGA